MSEPKPIENVLFVVESLGRGGTEESIRRLVAELSSRGVRCTVAHAFPPRTMADEIATAGADVVWLGATRRSGLPGAILRLARLERRLGPDVVHCHLYFAALATSTTGGLPGAPPRFLTLHSIDYFDPSDRWQRKLRRLGHRWALKRHRLTAVTEDVADHFVEQFGIGRPHVIANPVIHRPAREGAGEEGLIVCPARLVRQKRQDRLIEAFSAVVASQPSARLVLAGEGPLRGDIERQVSALGLQDSVELRGEIDQESVLALMREARVVALASDYEGFGMGVADAMALGVPVVVTRVDGLAEVVGDSAGAIAVEPEDTSALSSALREALDAERSIEMGRTAREDTLQRFAPATIADQLLACFAEEIADGR